MFATFQYGQIHIPYGLDINPIFLFNYTTIIINICHKTDEIILLPSYENMISRDKN